MLLLRQQTNAIASKKAATSDRLAILMDQSVAVSAELTKSQGIIESQSDAKKVC